MLKSLRNKIYENSDLNRLISNILSLFSLQAANHVLQLLTIPYLVRVLGPEYFGVLAFATATIAFMTLITDYGFNLSATRQIALYKNNIRQVNEIFSAVMVIKIVLMLISLLVLIFLVLFFETFNQYWYIYFLTFGIVIGQSLFPIWLFQGMEKMKHIARLNIYAKFFFTICIFIFVQEEGDFFIVPLLTSMGFIVAGIVSLVLAKRKFGVSFYFQDWEVIKFYIQDGWHMFFASISTSMYIVSTTFILGLFANASVVGYFSAAEKILIAVKALASPFIQATYPVVSERLHNDRSSGLIFVRNFSVIIGSGMLVISLFLFLFAGPIVDIVLGDKFQESIILLKIMAFLPFVGFLCNIFGIQLLTNLGYRYEYSVVLFSAAILSIIASIFFVPYYEQMASAVILLSTEVFVMLAMMFVFYKKEYYNIMQ